MAQISVEIDLAKPDFHDHFVWEGSEADASAMAHSMRQHADRQGVNLARYIGAVLANAPMLLGDPNPLMQRGARNAIMAFVLQCPTSPTPDVSPGKLIEYLPAYDFRVRFTGVENKIDCTVEARISTAGTA